jgi:glucosylceramidase
MQRRRLLGAAIALVGLLAAAITTEAPAQAWSGYDEIRNDHANKCVGISGGSTAFGALTLEWDCSGNADQQWRLVDVGNLYWQVIDRNSGLCLDVRGGQAVEGSRVDQELCDQSKPTQRWTQSVANSDTLQFWLQDGQGMCLALSPNTSANGTAIIIGYCSDTTAKFWHFNPV